MRNKTINSLLLFNAVTAIAGGLMLMWEVNTPPQAWLANTIFTSYFIPGLLLLVIVGGSALAAFVYGLEGRSKYSDALALLSGVILIGWIIDEMALLGQFSWLQLLYLTTGGVLIALTQTSAKKAMSLMLH